MIPFNYHHLYYFYIIAEEGSVTKAAKKLRLAQSNLSMQLGQFENFLETKLFTREGKKIFLTEEGYHVLSYAKSIFDIGEELSNSLSKKKFIKSQNIQIGISSFVPKSFADKLLHFLFYHGNNLYVNVVENSLQDMIQTLSVHKLDMILSDTPYQAPSDQGIENHLIAKIPIVMCANKTIAKKFKKFPADIEKFPVILPTSQSNTYHAIQEYFLTNQIKPKIVAEIQDLELVRRLVLTGKGIAPMNLFTVTNAPAKARLEIVSKTDDLDIHHSIYLIKKQRQRAHPLISEILNYFESH